MQPNAAAPFFTLEGQRTGEEEFNRLVLPTIRDPQSNLDEPQKKAPKKSSKSKPAVVIRLEYSGAVTIHGDDKSIKASQSGQKLVKIADDLTSLMASGKISSEQAKIALDAFESLTSNILYIGREITSIRGKSGTIRSDDEDRNNLQNLFNVSIDIDEINNEVDKRSHLQENIEKLAGWNDSKIEHLLHYQTPLTFAI